MYPLYEMSYIQLLKAEARLTNICLIQLAQLNHNFHFLCKLTDAHILLFPLSCIFTRHHLGLFLNLLDASSTYNHII